MAAHPSATPSVVPKKWTVMLYMATTVDSSRDGAAPTSRADQTERAAIRDLLELEKVGTTARVNVVVQIDRPWPGYAERYCIKKGGSEFCEPVQGKKDTGEPVNLRNIGDPAVFKAFLDWAQSRYPADHYLLVLWGHAYGLGFGRDHGNALTMAELADALQGRGIDILGANACAMSYAEAAYQLRSDTAHLGPRFLIAPEVTMPFAGWPYEEILKKIVSKPEVDPQEVGKLIVDQFVKSFEFEQAALTMLDLTKTAGLENVKNLTGALKEAMRSEETADQILDAFLNTAHGEVRPLIDLRDLCHNLRGVHNQDVQEQAKLLEDFLEPGDDNFVVEHQAKPELEGLHGVGIFVPSLTHPADLRRLDLGQEAYKKLDLMVDDDNDAANDWHRLVFRNLRDRLAPLNAAAAQFVSGTAATGREDRASIAQLFVGIVRAFRNLEQSLLRTKATVIGQFDPKAAGAAVPATYLAVPREEHRYLRLASDVRQREYAPAGPGIGALDVNLMTTAPAMGKAEDSQLRVVTQSLSELEEALARVEKVTRRVLTHARLGLGAPDVKFGLGAPDVKFGLGAPDVKFGLGAPDVKFGLGAPDVKFGLGAPDVKFGLGAPDVKFGLGSVPWLVATGADGVAVPSEAGTVAGLYSRVARSLQLLEESLAKVENLALASDIYHANGNRQQLLDRIARAFREFEELLAHAKQTARWVLAHPTYGLGPGPQHGLGSAERLELAAAGGFSSLNLRLL